jgi:phosphoenolpyruvate carboxylase
MIRLLGNILGEVIVEQEGTELFALEETIRRTTKSLRHKPSAALQRRLRETVAGMDTATMAKIVRAFTIFFQLINIAEQRFRLRRLTDQTFGPAEQFPNGSLRRTLATLKGSGVTAGELSAVLSQMRLQPVFTAHPTEALRRTVLEKHSHIWTLLGQLDDPALTPDASEDFRLSLKRYITSLWQTEETRSYEITPLDEVSHGLHYFKSILTRAIPSYYREFERSLAKIYPEFTGHVPSFIAFGSWMGGDRDGNPFVTASITWQSLVRQTQTACDVYLDTLDGLYHERSESEKIVGVTDELRNAVIEGYARTKHSQPKFIRNENELYRKFIALMHLKVTNFRNNVAGEVKAYDNAYRHASEFLDDLYIFDASLR